MWQRTGPDRNSHLQYCICFQVFLVLSEVGRRRISFESLIQKLCIFLISSRSCFLSIPVPLVWITSRGGMEAMEIRTTPITTARKRPWSFSISNFLLVCSWRRFRSGSAWKQPPSYRKMDLTKVLEATYLQVNCINDGSNLSGKNSWKTLAERSTWPRSCMMFVSSF